MTVAALEPCKNEFSGLREADVEMRFTRDRGPGGQHRNKTDSCVVLTHRPTGITVKVDGRSQHANRAAAWAELERRIRALHEDRQHAQVASLRASQVGSGQRGDKVRTYREQDNQVTDHRNGRRARLSDIKDGRLELLHDAA